MAASNEVTIRRLRDAGNHPALRKYAMLGQIFLEGNNEDEDFLIDGFMDYLYRLTDKLYLPGLNKAGVKVQDLQKIASLTECKNNPVKLEYNEILEILQKRFI
jgi:alcohol dehydrogenase class IV